MSTERTWYPLTGPLTSREGLVAAAAAKKGPVDPLIVCSMTDPSGLTIRSTEVVVSPSAVARSVPVTLPCILNVNSHVDASTARAATVEPSGAGYSLPSV